MWCYSNDKKRKTKRGMKTFINSWLSRVVPTPSPTKNYVQTDFEKQMGKLFQEINDENGFTGSY